MSRSPLSFLKKRKNNAPASSSINTTAVNMNESAGSMVLTSQPSSDVVAAPSSVSPMTSPDNLRTTDGRFGIQTISNPANADMDIWFVHGLTGDRESTWTHQNGTFTPDLMRTQFPPLENASGEGLRGHGKALAYAISNNRSNEVERPIFFIAHSLGGLVTEQALLVSLEPGEPRLRSIATCTAGIIFMGTPHSGSYLATWGYTLARLLDRFWRANKDILSVLKQQSEVLKGTEEVFRRQLTADGTLSHIKIFCFYETVAVDVVGFVVPEESATMLPYPNCGIDSNHMDMTKFTSINDAGFISVKGVLDDWIKQGKERAIREPSARLNDVGSIPRLTFNNGLIKADVFQQGTGNAGRDINYGNVTNQSAGRDWINRDQKIYGKAKYRAAADVNMSDSDE